MITLTYLDSYVVGEQSKITHPESLTHLLLELVDVVAQWPSDEQVIDIDTHHQWPARLAPGVYDMLMVAAREAEGVERRVQL